MMSKRKGRFGTEGVDMKSPLALTGAIALKEAAACMADARKICRNLGNPDADNELRACIDTLEPIARALHKCAQNGDAK